MDAVLNSATITAIAAIGGMFITIMGGLLHVIFRLGNLYNKVDSMEKDIEELRRYVFPVPFKQSSYSNGPRENA